PVTLPSTAASCARFNAIIDVVVEGRDRREGECERVDDETLGHQVLSNHLLRRQEDHMQHDVDEVGLRLPAWLCSLVGGLFSAFVGVAVAAHRFPDSEFYAQFKFWAGALILLIVALGSLVITAALI